MQPVFLFKNNGKPLHKRHNYPDFSEFVFSQHTGKIKELFSATSPDNKQIVVVKSGYC